MKVVVLLLLLASPALAAPRILQGWGTTSDTFGFNTRYLWNGEGDIEGSTSVAVPPAVGSIQLSHLYVWCDQSTTVTVTLLDNTTPTGVTCTIASGFTCNDTTHTTNTSGVSDVLSMQFLTQVGGHSAKCSWSVSYVNASDGSTPQSIFAFPGFSFHQGTDPAPAFCAPQASIVGGRCAATTSDLGTGASWLMPTDGVMTGISAYVHDSGAPVGQYRLTYINQSLGSPSDATASVSDNANGGQGSSVCTSNCSFTDGDRVNVGYGYCQPTAFPTPSPTPTCPPGNVCGSTTLCLGSVNENMWINLALSYSNGQSIDTATTNFQDGYTGAWTSGFLNRGLIPETGGLEAAILPRDTILRNLRVWTSAQPSAPVTVKVCGGTINDGWNTVHMCPSTTAPTCTITTGTLCNDSTTTFMLLEGQQYQIQVQGASSISSINVGYSIQLDANEVTATPTPKIRCVTRTPTPPTTPMHCKTFTPTPGPTRSRHDKPYIF